MFGNLLEGKKGLIMGVSNNKSIAWGIAEICNKAGAELAFTYQSDALLKRLEPLANSIGSNILSIMLFCAVLSRIYFGYIADKIGSIQTLLLGSSLQAFTLFLFIPFSGLNSFRQPLEFLSESQVSPAILGPHSVGRITFLSQVRPLHVHGTQNPL